MNPEELKQATKEFIAIYNEEFREQLTEQEATKKAQGLLQLVNCLFEAKEV